jgi:hypothetical protein
MPRHMALTLTTDERMGLERRPRSRKLRADDARRAQVILMLADGKADTMARMAKDTLGAPARVSPASAAEHEQHEENDQ